MKGPMERGKGTTEGGLGSVGEAAKTPGAAGMSGLETTPFEAELQSALQPAALPAGFVERVLAAAAAVETGPARVPKRAKLLPFRPWRTVAGGAIAAGLLAGSFFTVQAHQRQEREHAAVLANQQFETATRITDETLQRTREQLRRAGVDASE